MWTFDQRQTGSMPTEAATWGLSNGDFADALSAALRHRRMTLSTLRDRLGDLDCKVSVATLSYWQTGRSLPTRAGSLRTVGAIERVLELPPNSLHNALRRGAHPSWSPISRLPDETKPAEVLARMGLGFDIPFTQVVMHDVIRTGCPDGLEHQHIRQLIRADVDGIARLPAIFYSANDEELPELVMSHGVRMGERVLVESMNALVCELVLTQTLASGQTHWFEYDALWPSADEDGINSHGRAAPRGATFLVMGVVFEGERPLQARFCHTSAGDSVSSELAEWRPVPREVQHTLRNAPPGTYELEWYRNQYDDGLPKAWD